MNDLRSQLMQARDKLNIPAIPRDPYLVDKLQISTHRVRMVKDVMPIPTICPHCQSSVGLYNNAKVYRGREYGDWPYVYLCENVACAAHVGLHPQTDIPYGTLATDDIRQARSFAKASFNPLWEDGSMTRTQAYEWLATALGIEDTGRCHIGWFDEETCYRAIAVCDVYMETQQNM
jgi:hypothetical protein